jgi:hypothetical protein
MLTVNGMTSRKRTTGRTTIYKTLHREQNIEQHNPLQTGVELRRSGRVRSSGSTIGTRRVKNKYKIILQDICFYEL